MEAMACGCAIIATDVGETYKLVSDDVGFRLPAEEEIISKQVMSLLNNRELAMSYGKQARRKVITEQTIEIYSSYLLDLYKKANSIESV